MGYNRVGTPKFFMDAALLARQWGQIETGNPDVLYSSSTEGKFHLNPSKVTTTTFDATTGHRYIHLIFKNRFWLNSISHAFVLGHNLKADNVGIRGYVIENEGDDFAQLFPPAGGEFTIPDVNGWSLYEFDPKTEADRNRITYNLAGADSPAESTLLGDISFGWSYEMRSPDLELSQSFSNESIKTQTTLGGNTLSNAGWNHKAGWIKNAWENSGLAGDTYNHENFKVFPSGRRQWQLKFSFLADSNSASDAFHSDSGLFSPDLHSPLGIFEDTGSSGGTDFNIKQDFMSRVFYGSNCFQLPMIFTPDINAKRVNSNGGEVPDPEFAIVRIDNESAEFTQVANNVYNISLNIIEVW